MHDVQNQVVTSEPKPDVAQALLQNANYVIVYRDGHQPDVSAPQSLDQYLDRRRSERDVHVMASGAGTQTATPPTVGTVGRVLARPGASSCRLARNHDDCASKSMLGTVFGT